MSNAVLARTYRPPNFQAMVGQEHVVQALTNALTRQRLHHAYLFTGTRGVGKTTIARILAKSLNCTGPDGRGGITAAPCGRCSACLDIDAGRFVDYVELDAASNRGVDEITRLLDQSVYKPVVGRFKVYMIDEVHMLSTHAFNAMLKTLEEPAEYLKFVLATTDPQKVPATVLSRCLQFNLRPMAPQTVQHHLADVLAREGIAAEPGALRLLARAARGSMRDALSLTDQAIAFGAGTLVESGVRHMLGSVDRSHAVAVVQALIDGDGAALVAAVDGLRALGLSAAATLEELAGMLQQMAVLQAAPDAVDPDEPEQAEAARLAPALAADEIQLFYSIALHGRAELALAPDEYSGAVMVLLRMLAFRPVPAGAALERASAPPRVGTAPVLAQSAAVAAAPALRVEAPPPTSTPAPTSAPAPNPAAAAPPAPDGAVAASQPAATPARDRGGPGAATAAREAVGRADPGGDDDSAAPWLDAPFEHEVSTAPPRPREAVPVAPDAFPALAAGEPARARAAPGAAPPLVLTAQGTRWMQLTADMQAQGRIAAMVRELALQAQCVALDDQCRPIQCRLRVERDTLRAPALAEKLRLALCDTLHGEVDLQLEAGVADDSPALRDTAARAQAQAEAERVIRDDPLVQALMAQYKTARIVPGSVKPQG